MSPAVRHRVFLLSPANCGGARARMLFSPKADFPLARELREGTAPLGLVFAFVSGLYFRGKLTYALAFARPPRRAVRRSGGGVLVITSGAGLLPPTTPMTVEGLHALAAVDLHPDNPRYRAPLEADARRLAAAIGRHCDVVLLGSIASGKYVDILLSIFGTRLVFPPSFVGRGDMSRGGLLLRQARAGEELEYVPVAGAIRHGPRPPRLDPATRVRVIGG